MSEMTNCTDCGQTGPPAEFHPYWVCVLVKAGQKIENYPELQALLTPAHHAMPTEGAREP